MKPIRRINFTKEGLESLKKELVELESRRPEAVKELSRAREMGDLSENGLYTAAKGRLRSMDSRMSRITHMIKVAVVRDIPKDVVGIGTKVTVDQNGKKIEYQVVGDFEADPLAKKVSKNSPIGAVLIGKKVGDTVELTTPKGASKIRILKIS